MKKKIPYLLIGFALVILLLLVVLKPFKIPRQFDERITLRQKDKIPYGMYAAYHLLPALFPNANFLTEKKSPIDWPTDTTQTSGQLIFITARYFEPEAHELARIIQFVKEGNYVFIIANSLSDEAAAYFGTSGSGSVLNIDDQDKMLVQLSNPPFKRAERFIYPGKKWDSYFLERDENRTQLMGTDGEGYPNFIQLQSGQGKAWVHLAPLAFSNYFVLHKNNIGYLQKAVSLIPANVSQVVWNEYYLWPKQKTEKEPNFLSVLWKYPSFKWALTTALITLLLFALIEMKRRRAIIPLAKAPVNDSLDYVRTLGRLYYDQKDHRNLARKMTTVFLDAVRNRYHLFTQQLDDQFLEELHLKTAYNKEALQELLAFVAYMQADNNISEQQLAAYHQQLETFYQNTTHG